MSFTVTKYQSDNGLIYRIRLKADRVTVAGTAPTAVVDSNSTVKVSKSSREFGVKPRGVLLQRILGTAPDTFKKTTFLPVLTQTALDGATFNVGATITIGSVAWTILRHKTEDGD